VLVLDPAPILLRTPETQRLWTALAGDTDIAVLGTLDPNLDLRALDGLEEISPVQVNTVIVSKTTPEDTYQFLETHWFPEWETAGYTFENHAFDQVIALEPGATVTDARAGHSRMTLPYLASDLGQQAINHVDNNTRVERVLGRDFTSALDHIKDLLSSPEAKPHLAAILEVARDEITRAAADISEHIPLPETQSRAGQNVKILSRAYVTAQLLSMDGISFWWEDISG
jgi:hypothetical protein